MRNAFHVNTALIWGVEDKFNPPWIGKDILRNLRKRGAKASFTQLEGAGHFVQEEKPQEVADLLMKHWEASPTID